MLQWKDVQLIQDSNLNKEYEKEKELIKQASSMRYYHSKCKTNLPMHASKDGIDIVFLEINGQNWRLVAYTSWMPTKTECQHIQTEK